MSPRGPRSGRRRRWWPILIASLALVVLAVGLGSWIVVRTWGPTFARERVEALLAAQLGRPVRVEDVRLQPWLARVTARGIAVAAGPTWADGVMLTLGRVEVAIATQSLWRRTVVLHITLREGQLEFGPLPPASSTVPAVPRGPVAVPERFELGPVTVRIARIALEDGRVRYRDPRGPYELELDQLHLALHPGDGQARLEGGAATLRVEAPGVRERVEQLGLDARLAPDRVAIDRLGFSWEGRDIRVTGEARDPWGGGATLGLVIEARVPLAPVARRAGVAATVGGEATATARIEGPVRAPTVAAEVTVPMLTVGLAEARSVGIRASWRDGTLRLDDLRARVLGGELSASASVVPAEPAAGRLTLRLEEARLAEIERLAGRPIGLGGHVRVHATLEGDLTRRDAIRGQAEIEATAVTVAGAPALGAGRVEGAAALRDGALHVRTLVARWSGLTVEAGGRAEPDGSLTAEARFDVDFGVVAGGPLGGQATLVASADGPLNAPRIRGRLRLAPLRVADQAVELVEVPFQLTGQGVGARGFGEWRGRLEVSPLTLFGIRAEALRATLALTADGVWLERLDGRLAGASIQAEGRWGAGAGQVRATAGPVQLASLPGVPASLSLAGTGRLLVEATMQPAAGVAASGRLEVAGLAIRGINLGSGVGQVTVRERDATAQLHIPAQRLEATLRAELRPGGVATAHVTLDDLALAPLLGPHLPPGGPPVAGTLSARATVEAPVERLGAARAAVRLAPVRLFVGATTWEATSPVALRWESGRLELDRLRLAGPAGTFEASGLVWGDEGQLRLRARLGDAALPALETLAGVALGLGGRVTVDTELDGTWDRLASARARARAESEDLRLPGALGKVGPGTFRLDAELVSGATTVTGSLSWPGLTVETSGRLALEARTLDVQGRLRSDLARLATVVDLGDLTGAAELSVRATGGFSAPEATGRLDATGLTVAGQRVDRVEVPFSQRGRSLTVERFAAHLGASRVTGALSVSWSAAGWRGRGALESSSLVLPQVRVEALRAAFTLASAAIEVAPLEARVEGVPVRATGRFTWAGAGTARAELGPVDLAALPHVPNALRLAGTASGEIEAGLPADGPARATGRLRFGEVRIAEIPLGAGSLELGLEDRQVDATLTFPARRLAARVAGRIARGEVVTARASLTELAFGSMLRGVLPDVPDLDGTLSAEAELTVPVDRPGGARGTLRLHPARLDVAGETWEAREPVALDWDRGRLRLTRLQLAGRAGTIGATGTWEPGGALALALEGQVPLGILPTLRPEILEAVGTVALRATVTGTTTDPIVAGEGTVENVRLLLRDYPEPLRQLRARLVASPRGMRLVEAAAAVGEGEIRAQGELSLSGRAVEGYRVAVTARRVAAPTAKGLLTVWDGDLELTGYGARPQLTGEVRLVRGSYTRELSLGSLVVGGGDGGSAPSGVAIPLRLTVRLNDNLLVRTRLARLRIGGTVSVEGTIAAPMLFGTIESREGQLTLRGHRFAVVTASARFADPRRIDPILDVAATARIREYDVTALVSGRAEELSVRLVSTPALPQEDLLALVAFGVTRGEFQRSAAGILAVEAAQLIVKEFVGVDTGDVKVVDVLEMERTAAGQELRVGKRLTDRATVIYAQNLSQRHASHLRVEYQLLGPVLLSGEQSLDGNFGADLVLRLRFR